MQEDLWVLLTRWRFFRVVFVADIVKMFRQVLIDERDTDLQLIIWRENPSHEQQTYRLRTVTYGTTSAPFLVIQVLLELATIYDQKYPEAAKIIQRNKYLDDFLAGADDLKGAHHRKEQLINILAEAGISLGKWASNYPALLNSLSSTTGSTEHFEIDEYVSTLGIVWMPQQNCFTYKVNTISPPRKYTKRIVLSETAKLFDPLGWLGPVVIQAKVIMQVPWIAKVSWDQALPEDIEHRWIRFVQHCQI